MPNAIATNYRAGVSKNQELIWKCNEFNAIKLDYILGNEWNDFGIFKNLNVGKKMKWQVNDININQTFIGINFSIWEWSSEESWGIKNKDFLMTYFVNPNDYPQNLNFSSYSSFVPFWFPVPVGEYLGGLSLIEWYDVDNRVLPTLNVEIERDEVLPGLPSEGIKIIAFYNDQGILNSYKLYTIGNVVILDISLDYLPPHVIPTLLGLLIIFSIGIILFLYKKRRILKNRQLSKSVLKDEFKNIVL
ncbi:MAG: hypothetical protein ACFE9I_07225 [Candidatus Hermodarchaeota archaeon]